MTKNSARKRAAREHQKAHPGKRYTTALNEVSGPARAADWAHGRRPWIRTIDQTPIICYLCGKTTMIRSFGDRGDAGRVQLYCDNPGCDAREIELIVLRDGAAATLQRADVQVLNDVPPASHHPFRDLEEWDDWIPGATPWVRDGGPSMCVFCGKQTCIRSRTDVRADSGRVQLYCENPECDVREVELIVTRDGTATTSNRPDVAKLNGDS